MPLPSDDANEPDLRADLATIRIHRDLAGPAPPTNPLVRLMGDTAQPLKVVTVVDAQTRIAETVVVPDLPMAYDLLRKAKYSSPRAKAKVASQHMKGIRARMTAWKNQRAI